ncbi:MAG TPA: hypothetical protein VI382_03560 [Candidatus Manganitrophaceae bacterium]|nr:hypothetical protein [Candidatus Manganitrophaceae bacterium]
MKVFSNPIILLVIGSFVFLVPRLISFLLAVSLVGVGLIGLLAQSDRSLALE